MGSVLLMSVSSNPLPNVAITTDMLSPIVDGISANIGVILPVGIAIFAIMIGIGLIPTLIKKFSKGK